MAAKHTPAPWILSAGWTRDPYAVVDMQCVYGPPRIGVVAHVVMAAQDGNNLEEREANARLVAAAPELLAELKALRRRFHAACMHVGNSADVANDACTSADAVIAAAEPQ